MAAAADTQAREDRQAGSLRHDGAPAGQAWGSGTRSARPAAGRAHRRAHRAVNAASSHRNRHHDHRNDAGAGRARSRSPKIESKCRLVSRRFPSIGIYEPSAVTVAS